MIDNIRHYITLSRRFSGFSRWFWGSLLPVLLCFTVSTFDVWLEQSTSKKNTKNQKENWYCWWFVRNPAFTSWGWWFIPLFTKTSQMSPGTKNTHTHTQLLFLCWQLIDPSMRLGVADSFCSTKPWIIGSSKCLFGVKMKVKGHGPSTLQKFKGFFVNLLQQNKIRTSTTRHDTSWNMTSSCSFLWGEEHFAKSLEKVHKLTRYSVQNTHRKIENRCILNLRDVFCSLPVVFSPCPAGAVLRGHSSTIRVNSPRLPPQQKLPWKMWKKHLDFHGISNPYHPWDWSIYPTFGHLVVFHGKIWLSCR